MGGGIDSEQGKWLCEISLKIDKPKILLTCKPIYVDGEYHPCVIEGGGTVDEIVRDPAHRYVAAIGGDIHNYQRYRVRVEGHPRPMYYIVSGGGGAYMSATQQIRKVSLPGIDEEDKDEEDKSYVVCYPRRGDSLSFYSKLYDRKFGLGKGWLEIPPDEAAAYMGERLGIKPVREKDQDAYVSMLLFAGNIGITFHTVSCAATISENERWPLYIRTATSDRPIATSYETICADDRTAPSSG